jgi:hypothetical protein
MAKELNRIWSLVFGLLHLGKVNLFMAKELNLIWSLVFGLQHLGRS